MIYLLFGHVNSKNRVALIRVSRFLLDLRYRNAHPNGPTGHEITLPTIQFDCPIVQTSILDDVSEGKLPELREEEQLPASQHGNSRGTSDGFEIREAPCIEV